MVLLRTKEVLPELLVLVTLPEETVEDFFAGAVGVFEAAALGGHAAVGSAVAGAGGATSGKLGPYRRNVVGSGRISGTLAAQVVPEERIPNIGGG